MKVVLLHAFPLDSRMWEPQREALAGHEVVVPDLYRLGETIDEWARAVLGLVEGEFALAGASMGGYCALAVARLAPERVRALVLAGARAEADPPEGRARRDETIRLIRERGPEALWAELRPRVFSEAAGAELLAWARGNVLEQTPDDLARGTAVMRDRADSTDVVRELDAPVLVAVGDQDPFLSTDDARSLAGSAADGRAVVFPGCGHLLSLEQPDDFNRHLQGVLG